jgi:hypothetical protein
MTLVEANKYSQDKMYNKIVEEVLRVSPLLNKTPHEEIEGNALSVDYEDEDNMSDAEFIAVNDVVPESVGQNLQKTFSLTTLIGDAKVNKLLAKTRSNKIDIWADQIKKKAKAIAHKWEQAMIYGGATGTNEFNGLHSSSILVAGQTVELATGSVGAALSTTKLDELCDLVSIGGPPDLLIMNRKILRRLSLYLRTIGSYRTERDQFGRYWAYWQDVPIAVSDYLLQTEAVVGTSYSDSTGGLTSSIFCVRFGTGDGLCGIQSGSIVTEKMGQMERYDASLVRLKWYCGLALYQSKAIAAITGVTDAAVSA